MSKSKAQNKQPEWRIYYANGSTFDSGAGFPEDAPADGVVCIVYPDDQTGRVVMHGWDWYWFHETSKQWWGCQLSALLSLLKRSGHEGLDGALVPIRAVKEGMTVSNGDWKLIMQKAKDDPDFLVKSASLKHENPDVNYQGSVVS